MVKQSVTKRILIFLAIAVGVPWIAALVIHLTVRTDDLIKLGTIATLLFGTAPALANVATRLITREGWGACGCGPTSEAAGGSTWRPGCCHSWQSSQAGESSSCSSHSPLTPT